MRFRAPDNCMEDYHRRRSEFIYKTIAETGNDLKERARRLKAWLDSNSPFSAVEKLANLRRALLEDEDDTMTILDIKTPTAWAREVCRALFLKGPLWDGDLSSKEGRSELVRMGYAGRGHGWNWLTSEGVEFALKVLDLGPEKEKRS